MVYQNQRESRFSGYLEFHRNSKTFIYFQTIPIHVREKEKRKVILLEQKLQMAKAKIKPLLPSLREKKRYLAYEVISKHKFHDAIHVSKAILDAANDFLGHSGMAKAGLLTLNDKWNPDSQRGMMRVNNKHVDELKASLVFVKNIGGKDAIVKSVGASGILRKAQQKYLNKAG